MLPVTGRRSRMLTCRSSSAFILVFELIADSAKGSSGLPLLTEVIDARIPAAAREDFNNGRAALTKKELQGSDCAISKRQSLAYSNFFEAQLLLGIAFMDLKEWEKAEKALLRAVEIKPENAVSEDLLSAKSTGVRSVSRMRNKHCAKD